MNYAKIVSRSLSVIAVTAVCAALVPQEAFAQRRGHSGGGRGPSTGRAVSRVGPRGVGPRVVSPRGIVRAPFYRPYYYGYRPGIALGFYSGFGYPYGYGDPYGYYGYGYPGYAYPAYGYGSYGYGGYGYGGYGYGGQGYDGYGYSGYGEGGIRIQGAPHDAQVFADGYYAGIVDDFDGAFQRLTLRPGAHTIEIRIPGQPPMTYDVNVSGRQTITLHAGFVR